MSTISSQSSFPLEPVIKPSGIPRLENGDHLSREEFERRYSAMPEHVKAELIEGIVYMASPVRHTQHGKPHLVLSSWLGPYMLSTPGLDGSDNATVRLDLDNEPQPDLLLYVAPSHGGRVKIVDDYIEGAPEFVAEVAASTKSIDLGAKKRAYHRNGVREYLVWRVDDGAIDWFHLVAGEFVKITPDAGGILRSTIFPGLWLDPAALLQGNGSRMLEVLQQGLTDSSHQEFVKQLANQRP